MTLGTRRRQNTASTRVLREKSRTGCDKIEIKYMNKHYLQYRSGIGLLSLVFLLVSLVNPGMVLKAQQEEATLAVQTREVVGIGQLPKSASQSLSALSPLGSDRIILEKQESVLSLNSDFASFQKSTTCTTYYLVRVGDTLATIALTHNVSLPDLMEANWTEIPDAIYVGQRLCVPGPVATPTPTAVAISPVPPTPLPATPEPTVPPPVFNGLTYTVRPGDTLFAIALSHGVSVDFLMEINGISDARLLRAGQDLLIPGSGITVAPAPAPAPVAVSPVADSAPILTGNSFTVQFFNNMTLSGSPVFVTTDPVGWNHDWGLHAPAGGVNRDNFSVSWDGTFAFSAGTHRFTVVADDGIRLHIDGVLVMTHWYDQPANTSHIVDVALKAGTHHVRLEYYDRREYASVGMNWKFLTAGLAGPVTDPASVSHPVLAPDLLLGQRQVSEDAVWAALYNKDTAALRKAIHNLPDLNFRNNWGGTPLHLAVNQAVNSEYAEMLSILLEHPAANIEAVMDHEFVDISGITPLHRAANLERLIAIRILLQHGANMEARDGRNRTPLLTAVDGLHDEATRLLLSLGANPNVQLYFPGRVKNGYTPVHLAVSRHNDTEPLRTILAYPGVNPNIREDKGNTPLHNATLRDEIDKVRLLLRHPDINPNRTDEKGRSPLHLAIIWGYTGIAKALLAHPDIDPNIRDDKGRTPWKEASSWSRREIKDELRDHPDFER